MKYLIKGASVLGDTPTDLLLEGGVIAGVGNDLSADGAEVVDATGLVALPGLVDLHDRVAARPNIKAYLQSNRRIAFNEDDIFRRYKELDA